VRPAAAAAAAVLSAEPLRSQTLVLRVLWMPVVFSVDNWVALRWQYAGVYMLVLTGWYEAWVLYSFYTYLEVWLEGTVGGAPGSLAELGFVRETPPHRHLLPCCCLRPWRMTDGEFVRRNKVGVLQYTLVQTLCTVITFGTQLGGVWHDGATDPRYAYVYVTVVVNLSQVVALYCLVYFYYTMHDALAPLHPLLKFMCIKLVIFFSFWQEMGVYALVYFKAVPEKQSWVSDPSRTVDVAAGIQNFLICFEMLVAAVAHSYAFPIEDYKKGSKEQRAERPHFGKSVQLMFSVSDILSDMGTVFGVTPAARGYETAPHSVEARSRAPRRRLGSRAAHPRAVDGKQRAFERAAAPEQVDAASRRRAAAAVARLSGCRLDRGACGARRAACGAEGLARG